VLQDYTKAPKTVPADSHVAASVTAETRPATTASLKTAFVFL